MSRFAVYHWIKVKAIKPTATVEALQVADERVRAERWPPFIRQLLWIMGGLSLAVAVLFFMAFNWQSMGPMFKFALLQGSILLVMVFNWLWPSVLAQRYQLSRQSIELGQLIGRIVLVLLVGGLLALFGQVYQTGADPWQLFALWSLLISVLVVSSGHALLWAIWSVLINVALALYVNTQPMWLLLLGQIEHAVWLFLLINGFLWLILLLLDDEQTWSFKNFNRLKVTQPWAWQLQGMVLLICLTYMGMVALIEWQNQGLSYGLASMLGLAGFFAYYRRVRLDLPMLALWSMSVMVLIITAIMKITDGWASGFTLFWLSIIIIVMTSVTIKWLKSIRQQNDKPIVPEAKENQ